MAYNINYPVRHIQQTSPMTCWSAAVSMILGSNMTAGAGNAQLNPQGGLSATSANVNELARAHGLTVAPPASWTLDQIARYLSRGPFVMLGIMPRRHAIVISGLVGDGTYTGTILTIHDPQLPAGRNPLRLSYQDLMTGAPFNLPPGTLWAPSEYVLYQ